MLWKKIIVTFVLRSVIRRDFCDYMTSVGIAVIMKSQSYIPVPVPTSRDYQVDQVDQVAVRRMQTCKHMTNGLN
jgi:hypothetical protein